MGVAVTVVAVVIGSGVVAVIISRVTRVVAVVTGGQVVDVDVVCCREVFLPLSSSYVEEFAISSFAGFCFHCFKACFGVVEFTFLSTATFVFVKLL